MCVVKCFKLTISTVEIYETYSATHKNNQVKHQKLSSHLDFPFSPAEVALAALLKWHTTAEWVMSAITFSISLFIPLFNFYHFTLSLFLCVCGECVCVCSKDFMIHLQFCALSPPPIYFQVLGGKSVTDCWCALKHSPSKDKVAIRWGRLDR